MSHRILWWGLPILLLIGLVWVFQDQIRGARPAWAPVNGDVVKLLETTNQPEPGASTSTVTPEVFSPIMLPDGFRISIFAQGLDAPRVLLHDPAGRLLASIPSQGRVVALLDNTRDGVADEIKDVIRDVNRPHGLAFGECDASVCDFYIAETDRVTHVEYNAEALSVSGKTSLVDLPTGGRHTTRTLLFREGELLVSIGSSCDTCVEKDPRRGAIYELDFASNKLNPYARGLRNAVFMAEHPGTRAVWVTEMGRDNLGDNLPPDEINIVEEGKDYGWPFCYGKNVLDRSFDAKASCNGREPSHVDLQAHSAPLGLAFIPDSWPTEYRGDLLVAYHGSWNRTQPTGYMIVRVKLDANGQSEGIEEFATGWLTPQGGSLGRPVGLAFDRDGVLFVSDDKSGVVYRIAPPRP